MASKIRKLFITVVDSDWIQLKMVEEIAMLIAINWSIQ